MQMAVRIISIIILLINIFCFGVLVSEWKKWKKCQQWSWRLVLVLTLATTIMLILLSIATFKHASKTYKDMANGNAECKVNFTFVVTLLFWIYIIPTWFVLVLIVCYKLHNTCNGLYNRACDKFIYECINL